MDTVSEKESGRHGLPEELFATDRFERPADQKPVIDELGVKEEVDEVERPESPEPNGSGDLEKGPDGSTPLEFRQTDKFERGEVLPTTRKLQAPTDTQSPPESVQRFVFPTPKKRRDGEVVTRSYDLDKSGSTPSAWKAGLGVYWRQVAETVTGMASLVTGLFDG